ncbi:hypothetical protein BTUL_0195g00160 [Botrytis tulipae]|uniref:Uncharacterized protein n=1 Tax=Botrytis tulipae TaxID=87230 RepID=A0A4Z1E924_9HELO|nr:hypothetical protein BTUL_0195g00160 [Botrytis tulipae]
MVQRDITCRYGDIDVDFAYWRSPDWGERKISYENFESFYGILPSENGLFFDTLEDISWMHSLWLKTGLGKLEMAAWAE